MTFCNCKDCKKMRKKGKILGSREMGFWIKSWPADTYEYYHGFVSDYVNFPKFMKGRKRKEKNVNHFEFA